MKMMNLTRAFLGRLPTPNNNFLIHKNASKLLVCQKSTKDAVPSSTSSSSSSSSESDDEKKTKLTNPEAAKRLNVLLQQIIADSSNSTKVKMAQPQNQREIGRQEKEKHPKPKPMEVQVTEAVKEVAENLGGDKKQTESELLLKLLNPVDAAGNLSDILKGMKIEREAKPAQSKAEQVRNVLKRFSTGDGDQAPVRRQRPKRPTIPITDERQV